MRRRNSRLDAQTPTPERAADRFFAAMGRLVERAQAPEPDPRRNPGGARPDRAAGGRS